jgi:hypothetical protein
MILARRRGKKKVSGAGSIRRWQSRQRGRASDSENQHPRARKGHRRTCRSSAATSATTASATGDHGGAGNRDVLFAVQLERHGRSHIGEAGLDIAHAFARVGAIGHQMLALSLPGRRHAEHQVSSRRKRSALVKSSRPAGHAPAFLLSHRVPRDQRASAARRSNNGKHWSCWAAASASAATPSRRGN